LGPLTRESSPRHPVGERTSFRWSRQRKTSFERDSLESGTDQDGRTGSQDPAIWTSIWLNSYVRVLPQPTRCPENCHAEKQSRPQFSLLFAGDIHSLRTIRISSRSRAHRPAINVHTIGPRWDKRSQKIRFHFRKLRRPNLQREGRKTSGLFLFRHRIKRRVMGPTHGNIPVLRGNAPVLNIPVWGGYGADR